MRGRNTSIVSDNVRLYDEMKFTNTVPYIKYATFGIVHYKRPDVPPSMADRSLKLMQYVFFSVPAVRPVEVVGDYPHRIGYGMRRILSGR